MSGKSVEARRALGKIDQLKATMNMAEGAFESCGLSIAMERNLTPERSYQLAEAYIRSEIEYGHAATLLALQQRRRGEAEFAANHTAFLEMFVESATQKGNNIPMKKYFTTIGEDKIALGKANRQDIESVRMMQLGRKYLELADAIPSKCVPDISPSPTV